MVPDWETNFVYFSSWLPGRYPGLWRQLSGTLHTHGVPYGLVEGTKDIWVRDFMPVQIREKMNADTESKKPFSLKFRYWPDYLVHGFKKLITEDDVCDNLPFLNERVRSDIILDGGNVVAARDKVILTNKVFKENRQCSRKELAQQIQDLFGVSECIFIPADPYDEMGHSDGVVRFIDDTSVLMNDYSKVDRAYGQRVRKVLEDHNLRIHEIPYFVDSMSESLRENEISSAVGNYVNYLRLEQLVLVPQYGPEEYSHPVEVLQELIPGVPIIPIECTDLARDGGILNCVTWTIRD